MDKSESYRYAATSEPVRSSRDMRNLRQNPLRKPSQRPSLDEEGLTFHYNLAKYFRLARRPKGASFDLWSAPSRDGRFIERRGCAEVPPSRLSTRDRMPRSINECGHRMPRLVIRVCLPKENVVGHLQKCGCSEAHSL